MFQDDFDKESWHLNVIARAGHNMPLNNVSQHGMPSTYLEFTFCEVHKYDELAD